MGGKGLNLAVNITPAERAEWEALRDWLREARGNPKIGFSDIAREGRKALERELRFPTVVRRKEGAD